MNRRCLAGCGRLIAQGSYCTTCKPAKAGHWSKGRDRAAQARFRRGLLAKYGGRCAAMVSAPEYPSGEARCPVTTDLRACHVVPLSKGGSYELSNGVLLCKRHDKELDPRHGGKEVHNASR